MSRSGKHNFIYKNSRGNKRHISRRNSKVRGERENEALLNADFDVDVLHELWFAAGLRVQGKGSSSRRRCARPKPAAAE